jgi:hypothetical protein
VFAFLTKNHRIKIFLKTVFGKHALKTKSCIFSLIDFWRAKHVFKKTDELSLTIWGGLPSLGPKPKNKSQNQNVSYENEKAKEV